MITQLIVVVLGGGLAHWALESAALLDASSALENSGMRFALLVAIAILAILKWRRFSFTASAVQMICLSFLGGAMDLGWMAVVTLWMLVDAMLLQRLHVARLCAEGGLRGVDNVVLRPTLSA